MNVAKSSLLKNNAVLTPELRTDVHDCGLKQIKPINSAFIFGTDSHLEELSLLSIKSKTGRKLQSSFFSGNDIFSCNGIQSSKKENFLVQNSTSSEIVSNNESLDLNFFSSETIDDPDKPSEGFNSINEAIAAIKEGNFVVVVDDEDRENEGDLIMAASLVTPEKIAFMVNHCTGIICVGMKGEDLDKLDIPLMVEVKSNQEAMATAFTVSVDARAGTSTGVSSEDRAITIQALASPNSNPYTFKRPGHIFPLRYREGGVLKRSGHTEAAVDLATLSSLPPMGVLCEIVLPSGAMARTPELRKFAKENNLCIISIADLVRYRRKRERIIERTAIARLPTQWGVFNAHSYTSLLDGIEHVAMVKGDIGDGRDVLVRVHSECLTGDIFGSKRCDCGPQLALAMQKISDAGRGVLVYLRGHEGRGIGLGHKLQAYNLQDQGRDTVEANVDLGFPADTREYSAGAQILVDVGVRTIRLMTNNPAKFVGLKGYGLAITDRVPVISPVTQENKRYLETKRKKMGHIYGTDTQGAFEEFLVRNLLQENGVPVNAISAGNGAAMKQNEKEIPN